MLGEMRWLVDLLLPPRCPGCGLEGAVLCENCAAPLGRRMEEPAGAPLGAPVSMPQGVSQLEWCAMYSGSVRDALHALKYRGERRLSEPLGEALAARWTRVARGGDLITWVPVHRSRRRERGFDQAEELARVMAARLGLPAVTCLERHQRTTAQHALGQAERADNTSSAFVLAHGAQDAVRGRWVVLVDDILTTGATIHGCARVLEAAGALAVAAVTVARDR
jgi:ComF family protein